MTNDSIPLHDSTRQPINYTYHSDNSHHELSDEEYSDFISAKMNHPSQLEFDEIIPVKFKGHSIPFEHTAQLPSWSTMGYCYLAAIKLRALQMYRWPASPTIEWLASLSHFL